MIIPGLLELAFDIFDLLINLVESTLARVSSRVESIDLISCLALG